MHPQQSTAEMKREQELRRLSELVGSSNMMTSMPMNTRIDATNYMAANQTNYNVMPGNSYMQNNMYSNQTS
jgi:hypothetical protein